MPFFSGKGYKITINLPGKGWMRGNNVIGIGSEDSVWALDNYTRGKKIEEEFGSNLPYDYPTIDIYDKKSGTVTIMQSLDTTSAEYQSKSKLDKKLKAIYNRIANFSGTYGDNRIDKNNWIKNEEIKIRKILLIIPENELTVVQLNTILEFTSYCLLNGIQFSFTKYQVAY